MVYCPGRDVMRAAAFAFCCCYFCFNCGAVCGGSGAGGGSGVPLRDAQANTYGAKPNQSPLLNDSTRVVIMAVRLGCLRARATREKQLTYCRK